MSNTKTTLSLSLIVRDPELQPRETLNHDAIVQYAEDMLAGITFPAVVVYHDGERYWLTQGWHRCKAAEQARLESIEAEIREGSRQDALWDAAGSNREHDASGIRRTNADKRRGVVMAVEARPGSSNRVIAEQVGVHNQTVSNIRSQVPNLGTSDRRTGSDGKSYPATRNGSQPVLFPSEATSDPVNPTANPTFNQTNDNVDWAKWTWNPVTGCEHNCVYCYARDLANRFYPEKFTPTFRPERLVAPKNTNPPTYISMLSEPFKRTAWKNVFVCSMADLFGRWVPDQWIEDVFQACRDDDRWNYLFLTKFPNRYVDLDFPPHSWVGTSVDEQKRVANAEKSFAKVKADVKWLSVEPMLEPLKFRDLSVFDWVVIGGQSLSTQAPELFPDRRWVMDLIDDCDKAGVKVYCKTNTDPRQGWSRVLQEYPDAFGEE